MSKSSPKQTTSPAPSTAAPKDSGAPIAVSVGVPQRQVGGIAEAWEHCAVAPREQGAHLSAALRRHSRMQSLRP